MARYRNRRTGDEAVDDGRLGLALMPVWELVEPPAVAEAETPAAETAQGDTAAAETAAPARKAAPRATTRRKAPAAASK